MILIGGLIVGITTIRAHVFPSIIGWVILITSVLLLLTLPFKGLLGAILSFHVNAPAESGHASQ